MAFCKPSITSIDIANSNKLESEHVTSVYDSIAPHFSMTRYKPWPRVESFIQSLPHNSLVADLGCGNGKYLHINSTGITIGCDTCVNLLTLAKSSSPFLIQADTTNLPFSSNTFDAVISIAVIHHLSSEERRVEALKEMARVLIPGGRMLVYVWAMEQDKRTFATQDVLVPWRMKKASTETTEGNKIKKKKYRKKKLKNKVVKTGDIVYEANLDNLFGEDNFTFEIENISITNCKEDLEIINELEKVEEIENVVLEKEQTQLENTRDSFDTFMRYYHVFRENELRELVDKFVSEVRVIDSYYDHENWCVMAVKLADTS
ncbi:hypothetical protein LOD99_14748 [Oopsacas minuta]|uniref:Methyltransferase type 11 domain-containing protein n=1 Tax=Oopsacas minuta TaxID=111878 RepID=A0AAV7KCU5_9METZ|nr:hypothetical protein LOD99_14748 [Oopsacas minuta]